MTVDARCAALALTLVVLIGAAARAEPGGSTAAHHYSLLAYSAAMEGRKAEALAAAAAAGQSESLATALAMGGSGWELTAQYAALVRFGLWDEMLAVLPPDARAPGLSAGYLYGRGVALAARGRVAEAGEARAALHALGAGLPESQHLLRGVVAVAEPIVAARIAASEGKIDAAVAELQRAVAGEDRLPYDEPAVWFFPVRHLLGAQLLIAGRAVQAERAYREDLERNPANGWSLYGLAAALRAQGRLREAAQVSAQFEIAWRHADVRLRAPAFWFAGPDTRSCECQRPSSAKAADGW